MICKVEYFPGLQIKFFFNREFCRPSKGLMRTACSRYFYIYFRDMHDKTKLKMTTGVLIGGQQITNRGHIETVYIVYGLFKRNFPTVKIEIEGVYIYMHYVNTNPIRRAQK